MSILSLQTSIALLVAIGAALAGMWVREPWDIAAVVLALVLGAGSLLFFLVNRTRRAD